MKKRWISWLLVLAMLVALMPQIATEARAVQSGTCGDNLTWVLDDKGLLTISGTGEMLDYDYYDSPWDYDDSIRSVIIEYGVTSIGDDAFRSCDSLTSVTIPNSVTYIGEDAFANCDNLTSVTIPDSVTSIGFWAFNSCEKMTGIWVDAANRFYSSDEAGVLFDKDQKKLIQAPGAISGAYVIPGSVTSIGSGAFEGCGSLTSVTISDCVTYINSNAFRSCEKLTSVTISNSVTDIGMEAFSNCDNLTRVMIPASVTYISSGAFCSCDKLTGIWVDEDNQFYSSDAAGVLFNKDRSKLIQAPGAISGAYVIPSSVTSMNSEAFKTCNNITSVVIPCGVAAIGYETFANCDNLISVTISNGVTSIGEGAFWSCERLTSVAIPDSVTSIGEEAFWGCDSLTSVTIPNGVTSIGEETFWGCDSLTSVTIPNSVTSIGDEAFWFCESLTDVTIPNGVTSIGDEAFWACDGLTSVTIPGSVTFIGDGAFSSCSALMGIWVDANNPSYSSDAAGVLFNKERSKLIQAPGAISGAYVIPSSVTSLGDGAFDGCLSLDSVTIPSSVTSIPDDAFSWCCNLTSVTIPGYVTSIGDYAFDCCFGLTNVTIPSSVTFIGENAFANCESLTAVYYNGSKELWKKIDIGTDNEFLTNATIHFNASVPNWDTYVDLNADVNSFSHRGMKYEISNVLYRSQLFSGEGLIQRLVISNELNSDEVKGYCHGLAASICLGSKGMIDFSSLPGRNGGKAHNYYSLLAPDSTVPETGLINAALRDLLIYYQLTQFTTLGQETKSVTNSGLAKEWRLEWFLSDLVAEAIRSEEKEAPFIFSYRYYDLDINGTHITDNGTDIIHGHSVVVCGYNWNDEIKQHEIQIYDENCTGEEYYVLSVSEDYTSFSFADANSRRRQNMGYATYMLEDKWVELRYYGISKVYGFINIVPMPVSIGESEETTTDLIVSANTSFKITNAEGESVVYTSGVFSGTMNISDVKFYGSETDPYWVLSVMPSEYFVLTETSGDCNMVVEIDGKEYSACCDGANSVTFSKDGVVVKGERVEYDIVMIPNISDVDMVRMKGTSTSNTTFCYSNSQKQNITVTSDSEMENIEVYGYTYFSPESVRVSESDTYMVVESTEEDGAAVVVDDIEMQMSSKDNPFTDVPSGTFYYEPVLWALENGITNGATETTYNPNGTCLRAQVVTFLHRTAGNPAPTSNKNPFTDVKSSDFFYQPVLWAVEKGITNGTSATTFGSYANCNRAAVVTFLWRAAGSPEPESTNNPFVDVKTTDFFYKPVLWAVEKGITQGLDATHFGPASPCNRAQVVTFLYRAYN